MLVDLVSRGGNLLLDIGPAADGTIPVIMEERLLQIGRLAEGQRRGDLRHQPLEGHAAVERRRRAEGRIQQGVANRLRCDEADEPAGGGIDAFFTRKGNDVFAILPRWPSGTLHITGVTGVKSVTLLGFPAPLRFKAAQGGVAVDLPQLPEDLVQQPAWALKLSR